MEKKENTEIKEELETREETKTEDPNELVELPPLFYDKEKYSAPVFVGWNGKSFLIPRGRTGIKVPRAVKKILDDSEYQKQMANRYSESIEGTKNLGDF